jgi:hypothetical protein
MKLGPELLLILALLGLALSWKSHQERRFFVPAGVLEFSEVRP